MARKPKDSPSTAAAAPLPEESASATVKARPAARRGRKAEASEPSPKRPPEADSNEATQATTAPDADAVDVIGTPAGGRPGRNPKQPAGATAASLPRDDADRQGSGMSRQADGDVETAPVVDDDLIVEAALSMDGPGSRGAADVDAEPGTAISDPARSSDSLDTSVPSKPAARWDKATDTVQFDWPRLAVHPQPRCSRSAARRRQPRDQSGEDILGGGRTAASGT